MRRIDEARLVGEAVLQQWCDRIGGEGLRGTGTAAHERTIAWVESELAALPGLTVRTDPFEVLRWRPVPEGGLGRAGTLRAGGRDVPVAGAVPYTRPVTARGPLTYLPPGTAITAGNAAGRVVLRDFPQVPVPYDALGGLGLHRTPDWDDLRGRDWDRPGLADGILHDDLLAAGAAGAAGVVVAFDLPRDQVTGYFEPHKGTHYRAPAVFVGADERDRLRSLAAGEGRAGVPDTGWGTDAGRGTGVVGGRAGAGRGTDAAGAGAAGQVGAEVAVRAEVDRARTRNVVATLPGRGPERVVVVTHTDGATWVQENGIAALLALARYFAAVPVEDRHRTIEFAFTTAHLHISREGADRYAARLDRDYDRGDVAFVLALEHLGARELVPVARPGGPGRRLEFTGGAEPLLWAAGPSEAIRRAVIAAVEGRGLERALVVPGLGARVDGQVPEIVSFGGLGTYFHRHLVPTTSVLTGPWSLWAPAFGRDAVDVRRLRRQVLAAGDLVAALDRVPRDELAGGYLADRRARAAGAPVGSEYEPPEVAPS